VSIKEIKFSDSLETHNINMRVLYEKWLYQYYVLNMSRSVQNAVDSSQTRTQSTNQYST